MKKIIPNKHMDTIKADIQTLKDAVFGDESPETILALCQSAYMAVTKFQEELVLAKMKYENSLLEYNTELEKNTHKYEKLHKLLIKNEELNKQLTKILKRQQKLNLRLAKQNLKLKQHQK